MQVLRDNGTAVFAATPGTPSGIYKEAATLAAAVAAAKAEAVAQATAAQNDATEKQEAVNLLDV